MTPAVVADASPLIALHQIDQLHVLATLFGEIAVLPAVAAEIAPSVPAQPWLATVGLTQAIAPLVLRAQLGPGESEALSLAVEMHAPWLLADERAARRVAEALHVPVVGTLGILLAAKRLGLVATIRPCVDSLRQQGFWIATRLVEQVLVAAGEAEAEPPGGRS